MSEGATDTCEPAAVPPAEPCAQTQEHGLGVHGLGVHGLGSDIGDGIGMVNSGKHNKQMWNT